MIDIDVLEPTMTRKTIRETVYLTEDMLADLKRLTEERGLLTRASLIRLALKEFIDRNPPQ